MKQYKIVNVPILAEGWSNHSGDKFYPIPASNHDRSPFEEYALTRDLWCCEQGKLRRELCVYIADKLEKAGCKS